MRIVQLANFYSDTSGGLRSALRALAFHYSSRGHEVVRIVPGDSGTESHDGTATVITIPGFALGSTGYRVITDTNAVLATLMRIRPHAIELSDKATLVGPASAMRAHGTRVVLLSHERIDDILRPRVPTGVPLRSMANAWNRRLAGRVDDIVCASAFAAQEFVRIGARPVHHIPFGVDLDMYCPEPDDRVTASGRVRLALVSRLSSEKAPEVAIDTVRALVDRGVDAELTIAGTGPMRGALTARAAGLPVNFLGHLSARSDVVHVLRNADVALAPCRRETFGLAVLEAMACGTPVVAAAAGALPELVAPGTGALAPSDGASFGSAVLDVAATDRRISEIFTRAHASRYPWSATAGSMLDVFRGDAPRPHPAALVRSVVSPA